MRLRKVAFFIAFAATATVLATLPAPAGAYTVRKGDTLWDISRRANANLRLLIQENNLRNPDLIYPGQQLTLPQDQPAQQPATPATAAAAAPNRAQTRALLAEAAAHQGVDGALVLAVAGWESGYNQSAVSKDGAVGLMQLMPATGRWAGPALLHRQVNLADPRDNAELGAALLHRYVAEFKDERLALAAYYQGEAATQKHGVYPSSRGYVDGILALRTREAAWSSR